MLKKNIRFTVITVIAALIVFGVAGAAIAQEQGESEERAVNAFMVDRIIGSTVYNMEATELGTIKDIVVDIDSGRVIYAIMDFCEFLCIEGKLFPVPWDSLSGLPSEGVFYLDMTREELEKAPRYNMNEMPEVGSRRWGASVFNFYDPGYGAVGPYGNYRRGFRRDPYSTGSTMGMYQGVRQPDSRMDTFATLFDPESAREISGRVIKVDQVMPRAGIVSQMYMLLTVLTDEKKPVHVYLAPQWYIYQSDMEAPFKSGDQVTAEGSWVTSETSPFLIATSIESGGETLKLREKDGTPMWRGWRRNRQNQKNK